MSEELRPCPQCGERIDELRTLKECSECEMEMPFEYGDWWCWKEIDRLKEDCAHREMENFSLKQQNEKMRKALEEGIKVIKRKGEDGWLFGARFLMLAEEALKEEITK